MSPPTEVEMIIGGYAPDWLVRAMLHLESKVQKLEQRMVTMSDQQSHLDTDLVGMHQDLQQVIAELKTQSGSNIIDFSGLDAFAQQLHATANPQPASTASGAPGSAPLTTDTTATSTPPTAATPPDTSGTTTGTPAAAPGGTTTPDVAAATESPASATSTTPGTPEAPVAPTSAAGTSPTATTTPDATGTAPAAGTDHPPYYVYGGTDPVATPPWMPTGLETTDTPPKPLYTLQGETAGQAPTGATPDGTTWVAYAGDTQPASA